MYYTPAEWVISVFGGVRKTARAVGRDPNCIVRWKRPKGKRGAGGVIPTLAQQKILQLSRQFNLDITANDLIEGREVPTGEEYEELQHQDIQFDEFEPDSETGEILP